MTELTSPYDRFEVVSSLRLRELGLTRPEVQRMVRDGRLHSVRRGYYSWLAEPTWLQCLGAAILSVGHDAVVSHRSAARLHGFCDFDDLDLTIRYPDDSHAAGVKVHRSRDLEPVDVVMAQGMATTSVLRTLCDLGLVLPPTEVERHVDHCAAVGLVRPGDLVALRERVGEHGRTGVSMVDAALEDMPGAAAVSESGPELRLWKLISSSSLPLPTRQFEVRVRRRNYRLDLAYPDARIALEYDGVETHSSSRQREADSWRQRDIESVGWRFLRFVWADLQSTNIYDTIATIRRALHPPTNL